jgi:L-methionine (R)-S-oxide reductase
MTQDQYDTLFHRLDALLIGETDVIAKMATIACELHAASDLFSWVGFYRLIDANTLKIGPYQGGHGCLTITLDRGVCGKCAREDAVQNVADVHAIPHHIACSPATRSEIVLPIHSPSGALIGVLDIDSDTPAAFGAIDEHHLQRVDRYFRLN